MFPCWSPSYGRKCKGECDQKLLLGLLRRSEEESYTRPSPTAMLIVPFVKPIPPVHPIRLPQNKWVTGIFLVRPHPPSVLKRIVLLPGRVVLTPAVRVPCPENSCPMVPA